MADLAGKKRRLNSRPVLDSKVVQESFLHEIWCGLVDLSCDCEYKNHNHI